VHSPLEALEDSQVSLRSLEEELPQPSGSRNSWEAVEEWMTDPEDADADELSPRPIEQTLDSLLDYLVRQRGDHLPWWSPREPLAEDLAATLLARGVEPAMVLEQIITVERTLTGDNADFLAGTQLDQPGVAGVYTTWIASTLGDTEITVTLGGRRIVDAAIATLRANSEIRENEDTFFQVISRTGGRPVININVVTAAVVRVRVKFLPAALT